MDEKNHNQIDLLLENARQKKEENDVTTALNMLLDAVESNSRNVDIISLIASCYYTLGEFERAEACWEKIIELDSTNASVLSSLENFQSPSFQFWLKRYNEALGLVENKNYDNAKELFRLLLEEDDRFVRLYQLLGLCYLACGEHEDAEKIWTKGLKLDTSNPALSNYLSGQKKKEKEEPVENKSIKKPKELNKVFWAAAGLLLVAVLIQSVVMVNSNRISSKTIKDMQNQIGLLSQQVDEQEELKTVTAASDNNVEEEINENDENSMSGSQYDINQENHYFTEGYNAYKKSDWKKAINNLSVVVAMNTRSYLNREALYYLARIYYMNKDYEIAEEYYLKYLGEYPNSNYYDDSLYDLGCLYYYSGDNDQAVKTFQRLKELEPVSVYIYTELFKKVMNLNN
jgi:tetratricopeptide (TPR) repeat protein